MKSINNLLGYEVFIRHKQYSKALQPLNHKLYTTKDDIDIALNNLSNNNNSYYTICFTYEIKKVILTDKDTGYYVISSNDKLRKRVYYKHGIESYRYELNKKGLDFDSIYKIDNVEYQTIN